uniref:Tc1-like transposase DDE domain-containing protein n=1 Tax=Seriola dumerili TaxID=41447 RepID=A0A3B4U885_SERDU
MTKCPRLTVQHRVSRLHVRQWVRRLRGKNLRHDCIQETTQAGGGSVMVWAGIHYGGKTSLVVLDGNVNAVAYRDILENHCLPHARRVYGNNFRLQDDNARAQRAAAVREFLDAEGVQQMPWPASSPDMNPIEHAWDKLPNCLQ